MHSVEFDRIDSIRTKCQLIRTLILLMQWNNIGVLVIEMYYAGTGNFSFDQMYLWHRLSLLIIYICLYVKLSGINKIQSNLSKPNPFGTEEFVQFRQVLGLHRVKLDRHLVDGTLKSIWIRQVFGLLRVWFKQVSLDLDI